MNFTEINEKEYETFWMNHPQKTFLSSIEIGKLRSKSNWNTNYVAIKQKEKIMCAAMLLSKRDRLGKYEFYSPRGMLIDYKNYKLLNEFVKQIKKYIKSKNGYIFRMDPYVINIERDIDGNIVENGIDNSHIKNKLKSLGFKSIKEKNKEQVSWMFSINLENKTIDEIFQNTNASTKTKIKKAEKYGIKIRELNYNELDEFYKIMIKTGERKNFKIRDINYFKNMYKLFYDKNQIKFLIAEINITEYIKNLKFEKRKKEEELKTITNKKKNKLALDKIEKLTEKIQEMIKIKKIANKDIIQLSASMFMLIDPEVLFLAGGNYEEYMIFNSQYLLQWKMIEYAVKNNFKKYNFYGIPADINKHPKNYGIYNFKKGFGGYVEELIGEFELPTSIYYYFVKLKRRIKKLL